ncbi:MAG: hypothetical protein A2785_03285 [Candidatus Chisholmbacteria bacterium RIFCSPHIGHO2_01_FULL_49_18]|uniref:Uncharacterized protein n=1 Tax=Candidatus Chisholmbacteria bacterium RIFCSPHIGHO2_01_FULL_49_18 TaxID=1797590 RepID=A0A1G1VMF6_9BACT|nr:MAG: hypothetical protein A2785_03285 [Candidatus Chisholmbacteria bacterium RIFCSPHIGHO2_01_FULL_49_18]
MLKRLKILTSAFFVALCLLVLAKPAQASEGTTQLTSTTGSPARCFVSSVLLKDLNFRVLVSCRDLTLPPAADAFVYSVWATSAENGRPFKLGDLDVGKGEFRTSTAFTEVFITQEQSSRSRSPSETILRGAMQPISFLEGPAPAPTPTPQSGQPAENFGQIIEQPTPTPAESKGFLGGIQRVGLIAVIVVFVLILVIAAITRARG